MWEPKWHGEVGWRLGADGDCGYIGSCYPCDSYEDGIAKALDWLRNHDKSLHWFVLHSFVIQVRYF